MGDLATGYGFDDLKLRRSLPMRLLIQLTKPLLFAVPVLLVSCMGEPEKKPMGPVSESSQIPWNSPVAGQGQGQFGMMPQNQYRR
jgi:hypothetical protein